jgi:hypothetical protein
MAHALRKVNIDLMLQLGLTSQNKEMIQPLLNRWLIVEISTPTHRALQREKTREFNKTYTMIANLLLKRETQHSKPRIYERIL